MYHWITFLCVALAIVFLWELLYTMFGVKLTTGQHFKYFYDQNLLYVNYEGFDKILEDGETFSYDVIFYDYELLNERYNTLNARLSLKEGDAIFTDDFKGENSDQPSRARNVVDAEKVIHFEKLLSDGKTYLTGFLKSEYNALKKEDKEKLALDYLNFNEHFSTEKIRENFLKRNAKDNRFRKADLKEQGVLDEIKRIEKLSKELSDFEYLIYNAPEDYFFRYTKFSEAIEFAEEKFLNTYKENQKNEIDNGKENVIYGLKIEKLTGAGKKETKDYFRLRDFSTSKHIILMAFDFTEAQPDLQFEIVSFINTTVRTFSDLYDNR